MAKSNNLIGSTLLASALTLGSLTTSLVGSQQPKLNTVSSSIASILYKRGLDEDVAQNISNNFIDDEELFATRINNLEEGCSILSKNEILDYLSKAALHREIVQLNSYQYLVGMVYEIKQKALNKEVLAELNNIALLNA